MAKLMARHRAFALAPFSPNMAHVLTLPSFVLVRGWDTAWTAMMAAVGRAAQHFQILWAVVVFHSVAMVHNFGFSQRTPKHLFHDPAVFQHVALHCLWVFGLAQHHIALICHIATGTTFHPLAVVAGAKSLWATMKHGGQFAAAAIAVRSGSSVAFQRDAPLATGNDRTVLRRGQMVACHIARFGVARVRSLATTASTRRHAMTIPRTRMVCL